MVRRYLIIAAVVSALFFIVKMAVADLADIHSFLEDHPTVKIYIELKNSSGDDKVDINRFKKVLEDGFATRKSHSFVVVQTAQDADLAFKGEVVEYIWMAEDPVDEVWGVGAAALDAITIENYARIQVQTELIATKNNKTLYNDRVKATMTQKVMPKDTSYEIMYPRFVKSIMSELFSKNKANTL